jgi:ubiquinone/menaquinone biosynthesis C-methylase UbiE
MNEPGPHDDVVRAYSEWAGRYDDQENLTSCWGEVTAQSFARIRLRDRHRFVIDAGCGTGHALRNLVTTSASSVQFVGVEPAENMRARASERLREFRNVRVVDGRFEDLPIETASVDYLYSLMAFHWTTDLEQSVSELARVLKADGEIDLFFAGRKTGREFTSKTTPIVLRNVGPGRLLQAAGQRKQLTRDEVESFFARQFPSDRLTVEESLKTYYDNLEGHWSWWMPRTAGHFAKIPTAERKACEKEIRAAIESLQTDNGIPYTVHLLHVNIGS